MPNMEQYVEPHMEYSLTCYTSSLKREGDTSASKRSIRDVSVVIFWTYGTEVWGCASKSSITIMQRKSVQNTEDNNKCTMVRHQPDPDEDLNVLYITGSHPEEKY
jgi:hypothetical protein